MMTKKDMKCCYAKVWLVSLGCFLNFGLLCGQSLQQLREKEKQCITYQNHGDWEAAAKINNELAMIPDNVLNQSTIRYKGQALFRMGHFYLHAHFYKYDLAKAISYFERASEYEMYRYLPELYLAVIYNDGKYGVCDYNRSLYWLKKGSDRRTIMKYLLGEVYAFGFTLKSAVPGL